MQINWSWDVEIDHRLVLYGYGGLDNVTSAGVCGGPGGDLPSIACKCKNFVSQGCGYLRYVHAYFSSTTQLHVCPLLPASSHVALTFLSSTAVRGIRQGMAALPSEGRHRSRLVRRTDRIPAHSQSSNRQLNSLTGSCRQWRTDKLQNAARAHPRRG